MAVKYVCLHYHTRSRSCILLYPLKSFFLVACEIHQVRTRKRLRLMPLMFFERSTVLLHRLCSTPWTYTSVPGKFIVASMFRMSLEGCVLYVSRGTGALRTSCEMLSKGMADGCSFSQVIKILE